MQQDKTIATSTKMCNSVIWLLLEYARHSALRCWDGECLQEEKFQAKAEKNQTLSREIFLFCRNFVWIGFCCFVSNFKLKCPLSYSFFMLHFSISFILQRKHLHRHWVLWFLKGQDEILAFLRSARQIEKKTWVKNFAVFKAMLWLITLYFSILFIQFKFFAVLVRLNNFFGLAWNEARR